MIEYIIRWEINIEAETPIHAAQQALAIQRDKESEATHFTAIHPDTYVEVEVNTRDFDDDMDMDEYRLTSTEFANAVGIMRYAHALSQTDEASARDIISSWSSDPRVADKIISGDFVIDGDEVIVLLEAENE